MMYSIRNVSDMVITGIKPGNTKKVKDLTTKHIKYHNLGLLVVTKEEDKKTTKKPFISKEDNKDKSVKKDEVKE